jgi:hypothetical protein
MKPIRLLAAVLVLGMASAVASAERYPDAPVYRGDYESGGYREPSPGKDYDRWTGYPSAEGIRRQGDFSSQGWNEDPDRGGSMNRDGRRIEKPWEDQSPPAHTRGDVTGHWPAPRANSDDRGADARRNDWRPDIYTDPRGDRTASPEYRFRGDPSPDSRAGWGGNEAGGYRFRPLTEREADRRVQTPGWRPLEPGESNPGTAHSGTDDWSNYARGGRDRRPGGLMEALTPTPRIYGFEPDPWR